MFARPGVHVSVDVVSSSASESLVNVTVAVAAPDAVTLGWHSTGTVLAAPVMTSAGLNVQVVPPLQPSVLPNANSVLPEIVAVFTVSGPREVAAVLVTEMFWDELVPLLT